MEQRRLMARASLPFWFRAGVAAGFGTLFAAYALLQDPARLRLVASPLAGIAEEQLAPLLGMPSGFPPFDPEPPSGAYRVNGMLVEYASFPLGEPPAEVLSRFALGFEKAGYEHKTTLLRGFPALVGFHPESKMLLMVRIEEGPQGSRRVRLSQQNLSQWRRGGDNEIPGLPTYPGATGKVLVEHFGERDVTTLTYVVDGTPEAVSRFYVDVLRRAGWIEDRPSPSPWIAEAPVHFLRGPEGECSVVATPSPGSGTSALLMVTLDRGRTRSAEARG
jgi:hypothetical protein